MPWDLACERNWLSIERSVLTAEEKSAKGIVGDGQAKLMRHSKAEKRSERIGRAATSVTEGPNGSPRGD